MYEYRRAENAGARMYVVKPQSARSLSTILAYSTRRILVGAK